MNQEIKAQWTTALRSKEFEQGTNMLETEDGKFCCLGVLCVLATRAGIIQRVVNDGEVYYGDNNHYLPRSVIEWAGLSNPNPIVTVRGTLSYINDAGASFDEIADLIERHL